MNWIRKNIPSFIVYLVGEEFIIIGADIGKEYMYKGGIYMEERYRGRDRGIIAVGI